MIANRNFDGCALFGALQKPRIKTVSNKRALFEDNAPDCCRFHPEEITETPNFLYPGSARRNGSANERG